jgi:DNA-binding winged helix-turn-helix (wHTH) protein/tetratricopeptide (TPR) repeat protein
VTDNKIIYRFGEFVLDPGRRELKQHGNVVEIEPRAFDLLVFLAQNHNRAVDKGELQDAVWPGVIVTETALTRAVMKARKAVDDDASSQRVIKTLHGHGYRFIAEMTGAAVLAEQPEAQPGPDQPVTNGYSRSAIVAAVVVLLVAALAWIFLRPQPTQGDDTHIAILPLLDNTENPELAWASLGLMSYVSKLIAADNAMSTVPEGSIIGLVDSFGWNGDFSDPENTDLLDKLRQVYGATHVIAMELVTDGMALRMNYSLLNPESDERKGTIVGDQGTELADGVVQAVYGDLLHRSWLGGEAPLVSSDPFNNEAFARGMALSLEGRCADATQFFKVIIDQEPALFEPRFEYAACLRILGEADKAEELLVTLSEEQQLLGDNRPLAQVLMTLGILYNRTGRLDIARTSHQEALRIARVIEDHELTGKVLQNLSIVTKDLGDRVEAENLLDLAVLAYQRAGRESLPGQLYSGRANLKMGRGELVEAETDLEMALAAFREIGDRRNEAMMLNNTGYLKRRQGKLDEAEKYHLWSLEIRQDIGDRVGVGRIHGMLSVVYTARGQYEDAIRAAESAVAVARETKDRLFEGTSLAQLAEGKRAVGDREAARLYYLEGRTVFAEIQDNKRVMQSDLKIARLDLADEKFELAQSTASRVMAQSRELEVMPSEVQAVELLGDIEMALGNIEAAVFEYQTALSRISETTWGSKQNTLERKLAIAFMEEGKLESAAPLIGSLAGQPASVQSLKAQAQFAFLSGNTDAAVAMMTEAKELAGKHWAVESEATLKTYQEK